MFQDSGTGLLAKAKLTGNVIVSKVVCSYTAYDNAFLKLCLFGIGPVVPDTLWQCYSCSVYLRMGVLMLD